MRKVIARLDPPSARSFGMGPLVMSDEGGLVVTGLTKGSAGRARDITDQLEALVAAGHAVKADVECDDPSPALVSLWIGNEFSKMAGDIGVPIPPLPQEVLVHEQGGAWLVAAGAEAWQYLNHWCRLAFRAFRNEMATERAQLIAEQMRWVLPLDARSRAACWRAAKDQARELEWQARISGESMESLKRRHEWTLKQEAPLDRVRATVFLGHSATRRSSVARAAVTSFAHGWGSFTEVIERRLRPDDMGKLRLMKEGQRLVSKAPLTLVLEVLEQGLGQATNLVVDSVRHRHILELLSWTVSGRASTVGVFVEPEVRRRRLAKREVDPEQILSDPTELEIDELVQTADHMIREEAAIHELEGILLKQEASA